MNDKVMDYFAGSVLLIAVIANIIIMACIAYYHSKDYQLCTRDFCADSIVELSSLYAEHGKVIDLKQVREVDV